MTDARCGRPLGKGLRAAGGPDSQDRESQTAV